MAIIPWPSAFEIIALKVYPPQHQSRSGGVSLSGEEQVVTTGFGRFRFGVTVQVRETAQRKAVTGFVWAMQGRANTTEVPLALVNDRTGTTAVVDNGPIAIGATSLDVDVTAGAALVPGEYFSRDSQLYVITTAGTPTGTVQAITVRPPVRATLGDGWNLAIATPACECRFASDDTGQMDLDLLKMADVTFEFVQA